MLSLPFCQVAPKAPLCLTARQSRCLGCAQSPWGTLKCGEGSRKPVSTTRNPPLQSAGKVCWEERAPSREEDRVWEGSGSASPGIFTGMQEGLRRAARLAELASDQQGLVSPSNMRDSAGLRSSACLIVQAVCHYLCELPGFLNSTVL